MAYPGGVSNHAARLVTLTPSPAIDRTYRLSELLLGEVNRATSVTEEFAGKGVNVSRNLSLSGVTAPAVVPLNARDRDVIANDALVIPSDCSGRLRVNITAIDDHGGTTKINQSAPELSADEWHALVGAATEALSTPSDGWLLIAGSFPTISGGLPNLQSLRATLPQKTSIALDTSGEVFEVWAKSGLVDFVKPNVKELGDALGRTLHTLGDVADAAQEVAAWGVRHVMVSMGADGFLGHFAGEYWWATCEPVEVRNTIGAGDASVSGFFDSLLHDPGDIGSAVARAAQWGAQKVQQPTSQLTHLEGLPSVTVTDSIDRTREVTAD